MPSTLSRSVRALVAVAAGLAAAAAPGGVPLRTGGGLPILWDLDTEQPNVNDGRVIWYIEPGASDEEPPGAETEHDAVRASFDTWCSVPDTVVRHNDDATRWTYKVAATDRINYIVWKPRVLGPYTLAATYTTQRNGVVIDSDIVFNDTVDHVLWSTATPGLPGYADIQSIATHETGHLLGLDHSPAGASSMNPVHVLGSIHARSLEPDDEGVIGAVYPGPTDASRGIASGTVRVGPSLARRGVPVFAVDARTGQAQASAMTDDAGRWRIRSLPPGPYYFAAAPLASTFPYSSWWKRAPTRLQPAFHADADDVPTVVPVTASVHTTSIDITMRPSPKRDRSEPSDDPADASPLPAGGAAAGRFDGEGDTDWFSLEGAPGARVDVRVRAWALGSTANPELAVLHAGGILVLASQLDRRPALDPEYAHGLAGPDPDCDVERIEIPASGRLLVRVRAEEGSGEGDPGAFYLVTAAYSVGVPDPLQVGGRVEPPAVRAGAGGMVEIVAEPRDRVGTPLAGAVTVSAVPSDGSPAFDLLPSGDGTFRATFPVPAVEGDVTFDLHVRNDEGETEAPAAAVLRAAGAVSAIESTLDAAPQRVEAGANSRSELTFIPRDAAGRRLGAGAAVTFAFSGTPAGSLQSVSDLGDGGYAVFLNAPLSAGRALVEARLDGVSVGAPVRVGFGWDLDAVVRDLGQTAEATAALEGLSRSYTSALAGSGKWLNVAAEQSALGLAGDAALAAARAVRVLARFRSHPDAEILNATAHDLVEALRRRAHLLVDGINPVLLTPDDRARLERARSRLAEGEARLGAGNDAAAARAFARAIAGTKGL